MAYQLDRLNSTGLKLDALELHRRIRRLLDSDRRRFRRLWVYYRNPMEPRAISAEDSGSARPYRQGQEWGLPIRLTGARPGDAAFSPLTGGPARKEIVIENDIGWRVETMVDYLFGKPVVIHSAAPDPARRRVIASLLRRILAHNGGILFLQQLALLGSVYGFVDVLVKLDREAHENAGSLSCGRNDLGEPPVLADDMRSEAQAGDEPSPDGAGSSEGSAEGTPSPALPPPGSPAAGDDDASDPGAGTPPLDDDLDRIARLVRLEIVEPARALPVLSERDYRVVEAYVQVYEAPGKQTASRRKSPLATRTSVSGLWERVRGMLRLSDDRELHLERDQALVTEILTPTRWQRYEDETLASEGRNSLGVLPLVHIQNVPVPFEYSGLSDVEPLLPLQDELNTRLSDRASRITLQSFKMYLGKGIENFTSLPVAPGRMWMTDNERAEVQEFGGDAHNPSEQAHIGELREAMDKASSVTPIAAGAIKGRIGRLTSAAALRVTLLALLAKTDRKRTTYGAGIERMCELALAWLDCAGLFRTSPEERRIELNWPSPLPENDAEQLAEAEAKARLGVPREVVLRELGYGGGNDEFRNPNDESNPNDN